MENITNEDFLQLVKIVQNMQQKIMNLEQANQVLIKSNKQLFEWLQDTIDENEDYKQNVRFEIQAEVSLAGRQLTGLSERDVPWQDLEMVNLLQ